MWKKNKTSKAVFIRNRIKSITKCSRCQPTIRTFKPQPADVGSRGLAIEDLFHMTRNEKGHPSLCWRTTSGQQTSLQSTVTAAITLKRSTQYLRLQNWSLSRNGLAVGCDFLAWRTEAMAYRSGYCATFRSIAESQEKISPPEKRRRQTF